MSELAACRLNPIGVVRSSLKDRAAAPRQGGEGAPVASIALEPSVREAVHGLEVGQDVVVLTGSTRRDATS